MSDVYPLESKCFYEFKNFCLDTGERVLLRDDKRLPITPKVFHLLKFLIENGGRVVEKEVLMREIWAETFVEEGNLAFTVRQLRKALDDDARQPDFIETVPRRGYRFIAEVRRFETKDENFKPPKETLVPASNGKYNSPARVARQRNHSERAATNAVVALADWRRATADEEEFESFPAIAAAEKAKKSVKLQLVPANPLVENKRSNYFYVLAGLIFTVVSAGFGFGLYRYAGGVSPIVFQAGQVTRLTSSGRVKSVVISPDGNFTIYAQEENDGRQSLWMQHVGSESNVQIARSSDVEYRTLNITPDGNSIYYIDANQTLYQIPVLGGTAKKIAGNLLQNSAVGFSPDGKQFTFVRRLEKDASALYVINSDGTNEQKVVSIEQPMRLQDDPAWSPDGKIIACPIVTAGLFKIFAVQLADGKTALISPKESSAIRKLAWLPDSNSLIFIGTAQGNFHQLFQISYPGGEVRQITSDLNNYDDFSLSFDAHSLAAVKVEQTAHLWITPSSDAAHARQITSGFEKFDGIYSLDWMSDGKILYSSSPSGDVSIWTIETDGGNPKQLLKSGHYPIVSPDRRFIVYRELVGSEQALLRMDLNDGSEKLLTKGMIHYPTFSPDGKWLVFTKFNERTALWKVPVEGGEATQILVGNALCAAVSPDGKTIAFILRQGGSSNRIALVSFDGGEIIKTFDAVPETNPFSSNQNLQWTTDAAIYYIALNNGVSNIWRQPVDGTPPVRVTEFETGRIFNFAYSPDGKQLALSRGTFDRDVILISNSE